MAEEIGVDEVKHSFGKVEVTIRPMGGSPKTVSVSSDMLIGDVLDYADISVGRDTNVVADGESLNLSDPLGKKRELILVPTVKGGS